MINILLGIIILFEIIRLILYVRDIRLVHANNKRVKELQFKAQEDWKELRRLEIEELKRLAEDSDTMKEIYQEYMKSQNKK